MALQKPITLQDGKETSTYAGAHSGTKIWATGLDTNMDMMLYMTLFHPRPILCLPVPISLSGIDTILKEPIF